jgi:hypothetical protein
VSRADFIRTTFRHPLGAYEYIIEQLYVYVFNGTNVNLLLNSIFVLQIGWMHVYWKKVHYSYQMFGLMFEHTKCIVLTNIIDLMFNIFSIRILTIRNMSTIYRSTPLLCQLERRLPNDHSSVRKHQIMVDDPHIQFLLCPESLMWNVYNTIGYSHVGDKDNGIEVGTDDFFFDTYAMEGSY